MELARDAIIFVHEGTVLENDYVLLSGFLRVSGWSRGMLPVGQNGCLIVDAQVICPEARTSSRR